MSAKTAREKRLEAFVERLLQPEALGYSVSMEVRDEAREALGLPRGEVWRYCEFTGDETGPWDSKTRDERWCEYKGVTHCQLHKKKCEDHWGFMVCCKECRTPFHVVNEPRDKYFG